MKIKLVAFCCTHFKHLINKGDDDEGYLLLLHPSIYRDVAQNFGGSLFLQTGNFLRFAGRIGFSCWELIFFNFQKVALKWIDNIFVFY